MKKILLVLALLFNTSFLFSQVCGNDSVVIKYYFRSIDYGNDITNTVYTDSFDLASGIVYSSQVEILNSVPANPIRTQGTFIRKLVSYNTLMDTTEYLELEGTGSGFTNRIKIEFTYTPDERPLTKIQSNWDGTSWAVFLSETWTYNTSDLIVNYLVSNSIGNISQKNYSYTGLQQTSIQFQTDISGNWVNVEQYLITYDASDIRDSLYIQRWDLDAGIWVDSIQASYDTIRYGVNLVRVDDPYDSTFYYLDSLNNFLSYRHVTYDLESTTWDYFNGHLKMTQHNYQSDYHDNTTYYYNNYGFLIGESGSSGSSISSGSGGTTYDSFSNPLSTGGNYSSMAGGSTSTSTNYSYSSPNHISLAYIPAENYGHTLCPIDSVPANVLIAGGCGPYTYSWNPSTGLSSDTIASPMISISQYSQYTITVTDSIGNTASTYFNAIPYENISIYYDTALCAGCPVILNATPGYFNYQWYRNDTLIDNQDQQTYTATESGIYKVRTNNYCDMFSEPIELTLSGLTRIKGHVYLDMDSDCVFNNGDRNLSAYGQTPFLINLQRGPYSAIINVDNFGNFNLPVDTGTYTISVINPSTLFSFVCPDSGVFNVDVPSYGDTITGNDFVARTKFVCEKVGVNVSSSRFRPCFSTQITVNYFNEGTEDANNPIINLRLPDELINISTAQPYIILPDNTYQFTLPPLLIGSYGSILINADVICNPTALANATFCIDADISPVNFCSYDPDSSWDGSYIRVSPSCENDSSCFKIYNIADSGSDMNAPSQWRLYADNSLIQQGTFQLTTGEDTTLCFVSDGKSLRLEADQNNNFPATSHPSANIERCGILQSGQNYSQNQILQSSFDNLLPFHNTYCARVVNSYDPNEKSVKPIGYGANHIVSPDERLTYRIDFQNAGNDTAFTVKIVDDLNYNFDLTSIQILTSSHLNNFSIVDQKLTWLFHNILLPDSNTDEANSHGYVEFSIKVKPTISQGEIIYNRALIYFDYNDPIYTFNTVNKFCNPETPGISIFPQSGFCSDTMTIGLNMLFPGTSPQVKWYVNGMQYSTIADTLTFTGINSTDTIYATLQSNSACAVINNVSSNFVYVSQTLPTINYSWPELVSTSGVSYQWYLDSLPISGATNQSYTPTVNGNYRVEVMYANGCSQLSSTYEFLVLGTTSLNSSGIKVYPNPSKGKFKVIAPSGSKSVLVYDLTGRNILQFNTVEKDFDVDLSDIFSSGVYYLTVRSRDGIYFEKVVIQP